MIKIGGLGPFTMGPQDHALNFQPSHDIRILFLRSHDGTSISTQVQQVVSDNKKPSDAAANPCGAFYDTNPQNQSL